MDPIEIYEKSVPGLNGELIEPGDIVLYTDNPFCKPSKVEHVTNWWVYTEDGCGEAKYFKVIEKGKKQ